MGNDYIAVMSSPPWEASDLPSFDGRTVVITGGNSGLGQVTARELARASARVVLAVRDVDKGRTAAAGIPGATEVRRLDLADLASIRRFADGWSGDIDVLVNNAGIMLVPHGHTRDGFERHIGTNHLGHFALTNLLLPHVTGRVVTVSSQAHRRGSVEPDDLHWTARRYSRAGAYAQSKLANLLFSLELQRRIPPERRLLSVAAHPGWAATKLQHHSDHRALDGLLRLGNRLLAQDVHAGARPILFAASQDLPPASYVGPDGLYGYHGDPTLVGRSRRASDTRLAKRLWDVSEHSTAVSFPLA